MLGGHLIVWHCLMGTGACMQTAVYVCSASRDTCAYVCAVRLLQCSAPPQSHDQAHERKCMHVWNWIRSSKPNMLRMLDPRSMRGDRTLTQIGGISEDSAFQPLFVKVFLR